MRPGAVRKYRGARSFSPLPFPRAVTSKCSSPLSSETARRYQRPYQVACCLKALSEQTISARYPRSSKFLNVSSTTTLGAALNMRPAWPPSSRASGTRTRQDAATDTILLFCPQPCRLQSTSGLPGHGESGCSPIYHCNTRGSPMICGHFHSLNTIVILLIFLASPALSQSCLPPEKPYLPSAESEVREYADLLRQDFENYLSGVSDYIACLDQERARAFREAQEVTEQYQRFIEIVRD